MNATRHRQRGAALVVGLVLLLILTLLAISGMNTATTELIMAGNEQYQARAFQASETGIERVIATGVFNPNPAVAPVPVTTTFPDADARTQDDVVITTTSPRGSSPPPPGYSFGTFSSEHFEIVSEGQSLRNATSTHTQGLFLVAPAP
jgi:type IV pilus assembly protein PilX